MDRYCKRLIEVDLPIKRISAHSRREKSIRHGHISTLHIWWARRPLAACRAVICASLWPDPADDLCPDMFCKVAREQMTKWAKNHLNLLSEESWSRFVAISKDERKLDDLVELRAALLDFIADFANWDNSTVPQYLETSRLLTQAAHEAMGGQPGSRPLVADPFAGGGAIPLEAIRVGADAFASDLNPLAVLLNKVMLEYIPKYDQSLASDVRKWGKWIKQEASKELSDFYPKGPDNSTPIAYLWTRTIKCEGPGCGAEVPLIGSLWLAKKTNRSIALQLVPRPSTKNIDFQIIIKQRDVWVNQDDPKVEINAKFDGTVNRGSATCPCCGYTTPADHVRNQLKARRGGTKDSRLICVVTTGADAVGRFYRLPVRADYIALEKAKRELHRRQSSTLNPLEKVPEEPTPEGKGKGAGRAFSQRNYGMETFADVYTDRQLLTLTTLSRIIQQAPNKAEIPEIVRILCAFALGRVNDLSMSLCRWLPSIEAIAAANGGQNRMPVVLDYIESNPFGGRGGDWLGQVDWVARVVKHLQESELTSGTTACSPAQNLSLPDDSTDAFVTDPPYYDAFPYSDLSDFFYIWLKRALGPKAMGYSGDLVPKKEEVVVYDVVHGGPEVKDHEFFQREMTKAFKRGCSVTKDQGIGMVVFANKTTSGWESLIQSIIDSGWMATASWPIDTERPNRQRAIDSAALGSSVHVVCRPRGSNDLSIRTDDVGDWRDVLSELPKRIHEWMPRLAEEGVVGADAIFACLGPALEVYSRYSSVEKASGEKVELNEYLEEVWAAVSREALNMIFEGADASGFEEDARLTAMWLWTLRTAVNGGNGVDENGAPTKSLPGYSLEYDAARKIAQGLGAHLEKLSHLVEIKGNTAMLLSTVARTNYLFGKDAAEVPKGKRKKKIRQQTLFDFEEDIKQIKEESGDWVGELSGKAGSTVLDQLHQSMILFAAGRGDAMKRFLVEEGVGGNPLFWRLAQALSALYPAGTDEKRWVDGVLARKKGLGF